MKLLWRIDPLKISWIIAAGMLFSLNGCLINTPIPSHGEQIPIKVPVQTQEDFPPDFVSGYIKTEEGEPISGAVVRLQATSLFTLSENSGIYRLGGVPEGEKIRITAYASGYYIKEYDTQGGSTGIDIVLVAHGTEDHPDYEFLSAGLTGDENSGGSGCAECHSSSQDEIAAGFSLPFDEWQLDAHSQAAINPRFLSMFKGTDTSGNQSPFTRYIYNREYGPLPIPPDSNLPYYGPGYILDFPDSSGNCATCHLPVMAINDPFSSDPNQAQGVAEQGVTCDFCHKIWDIILNASTGLPYPNMTGVLAYEFRRPADGHQFFAGPFDDVAPGEDTFSPLQNESQFCAGCHQAEFWGVSIYNSFGEWLESPYADQTSAKFQTCQDCHMPPLGMDHFAKTEKGGLKRDPDQIFSHRMPGAADQALLENTAELTLDSRIDDGSLVVDVSIFNNGAGHHIPTDSPLRQIFLLVEVEDETGVSLDQLEGQRLPDWAGDLAGAPGTYFAKILRQLWTEEEPTGAYWTQTQLIEDSRLPALETNTSQFIFSTAGSESMTIRATLIFRRAYYDLMVQKGWDMPDIIMETVNITLP
jgi:hypothetical protein